MKEACLRRMREHAQCRSLQFVMGGFFFQQSGEGSYLGTDDQDRSFTLASVKAIKIY